MQNQILCIRCGKERVVAKTWKEYIERSLVTYTQYVCPDPVCQKIVEFEFKKKKDHLAAIYAKSLKRKKENRRNRKFGKSKIERRRH